MTSPNPSGITVTPPGWVDPHSWSQFPPSIPWVAVSPTGLATGAGSPNNGCPYGPDTPGTSTCGIQEAINGLPACTVSDKTGTLTGRSGYVFLLPGVFSMTGTVSIPPGAITIQGSGWSSWIPIRSITPYEDIGGTQVVTTSTQGGLVCLVGSNGNPATTLNLRDMDIRVVSPSSPQTSSTPAVLDLRGWFSGEVRNVNALEVKVAGGIGSNMLRMVDGRGFGSKDTTVMMNVRGFGGNIGIQIQATHMVGIGLTGGQVAGTIISYPRCIDIQDDLGTFWADLHVFSGLYGLGFGFAEANGYTPSVIHGCHFEAVTHYMTTSGSTQNGTLFLAKPCWNSPNLDPRTDIPANVSAGLAVVTSGEQDETGSSTGVKHVTAAPAATSAGASPYTFTPLLYPAVYVITTVGGMTALTLDGQALFNGSFSIGQQVYVGAGHSLVATWATTAPVFQVLPL